MTQTISSPDPLLINIVLITLAVGLPILTVLLVRFLWDRNLHLGRSKELEKLIWQLHRIATALEHQMNLSFPAVQPGTEEPRDIAFLKPLANRAADLSASAPATAQPEREPLRTSPAAEQSQTPSEGVREPSTDELPRRAGVNSMFGL